MRLVEIIAELGGNELFLYLIEGYFIHLDELLSMVQTVDSVPRAGDKRIVYKEREIS
jgi:hypothetical protein